MAELVGVAASAIGIAGAAVQLTECVIKLQRLAREIKNAPPRLRCLLEEIEIAGDLLAQFSSNRTPEETTVDPHLLNRCISLCHLAVDDLAAVVIDLQASLRRSKLRCAIDLVLHKVELQELIQRVQGSLGLLHLAHSAFAHSSNQQQLAAQRDLLEEIKDCQMTTSKTTKVLAETQKHVTSSLVIPRPKTKYLARTPSWLLRQSWEISVSLAISGFTFSLRSYRISPAIENPAFDCCRSGDLDGLTKLLKERRASIYDEDEDGSSLFMFAVVGCSFDMAHLLVQAGIDPQKAGNDELHSVAAFREYTRWQILTLEDVTNHLQFLMDDCDINADDCWYGTALRLLANGLSEKTTPHERLLVFDSQLSAQWSVSKNLAPLVTVFEPALHDPKYFELNFEGRRYKGNLLHFLAEALGVLVVDSTACHEQLPIQMIWLIDLITTGVTANANIHGLSTLGEGLTPLMHLILGCMRPAWSNSQILRSDRGLNSITYVLNGWLSTLDRAGVSLEKYGRREQEQFRRRWSANQAVFWNHCYSHIPLIGFTPAKLPNEWEWWWEHPGDCYAGVFWAGVEDQKRHELVPGQWPTTAYPEHVLDEPTLEWPDPLESRERITPW